VLNAWILGDLVDDARRMEVIFPQPCFQPIGHFVPDPFAYSAPGHLSEPEPSIAYFLVVKAHRYLPLGALKGVGDLFPR
jgi:hypothetical protein